MLSKTGKTYISSGLLLPSKVTHLVIKRPLHFDYHPGDYVFVNIPAIAKYEWHPFTISSAPEQEGLTLIKIHKYLMLIDRFLKGYMWLHVRGVGEWTNRLYEYFEKQQEKLHNGEIAPLLPEKKTITNGNVENNNTNPIKKIQATITRSFSNRDPNRKSGAVQLVSFTNEKEDGTKVKCTDDTNRASCSTSGIVICFLVESPD